MSHVVSKNYDYENYDYNLFFLMSDNKENI